MVSDLRGTHHKIHPQFVERPASKLLVKFCEPAAGAKKKKRQRRESRGFLWKAKAECLVP